MKFKKLPSQQELHMLLDYDSETGCFIWKPRNGGGSNGRWNGKFAGKVAGTKTKKSCIIFVDSIPYAAHRLAWAYVYGSFFDQFIVDHKNCDPHDNRITNLRLATHGENSSNSRKRHAKALLKGVSIQTKDQNRFRCRIGVNKKVIYLGTYDSAEEANYWYNYAAQYYKGEFARAD